MKTIFISGNIRREILISYNLNQVSHEDNLWYIHGYILIFLRFNSIMSGDSVIWSVNQSNESRIWGNLNVKIIII